jgi:succinate dehydrogenase / fumarate reductase, membrane anchor subunit
MSNMKTPLKKARGLGSAKSGTEHFWQQRLTAIFNLPLILFFVWFIVRHLGATRSDVMASLHNPFIAILLLGTLASVFWHMRLGMQVIIEDYVHGHGGKLAALILNTTFAAALFLLSAFSILKMSFA